MWVTALLLLLAVALIVVAIVYFTRTAADLPSFFPGHQAGDTKHHTKHGIAAAVAALVVLGGAWLSSGRKKTV